MVKNYKELRVYQNAFKGAVHVFQLTKRFPREELYSQVSQMRRASRAVCANLGEAWRRRRYRAAFIAKLNDVESEASEMQVWVQLAAHFGYISAEESSALDDLYDHILAQVVSMVENCDQWVIPTAPPIRPPADPPNRTYSSENR